uniref:rootletin-like n=1 Tax=Pristiophorus japonicus TaxID=55135 RepID=UPI00398E74EF
MEEERESQRTREAELEREVSAGQEALLRRESERAELEAEGQRAAQSLQRSQVGAEGLRKELDEAREAATDLRERLTQVVRQRTGLSEDAQRTQHRLQALTETLIRSNRDHEALARDKASVDVQLTTAQRENRVLGEELAGLRMAKETLETQLFEAAQRAMGLDGQVQGHQAEIRALQEAKESLQGSLSQVRAEQEQVKLDGDTEREGLKRQLSQALIDSHSALQSVRTSHDQELEQLREEKVSLEGKFKCGDIADVFARSLAERLRVFTH